MVCVNRAEVYIVQLPLKSKFKHAITTRLSSDSIFVKLVLSDGTTGYGEALPREYVTGETPASVLDALEAIISKSILGRGVDDYRGVAGLVDAAGIAGGAARCALELALLDAYGRHFGASVSAITGRAGRRDFVYSGVIQADSVKDAIKKSLAFRVYGLRFVKVKVGSGDDLARLSAVRAVMGARADIRVDANCAWSADEAIERMGRMRRFGISAVEQPVKADDHNGLKKVTDAVTEKVIADESLCTVADAERLAGQRACGIFNIRISKCGGIMNSLRIADIARRNGIGLQIGCQVGESGLLSAAGWHLINALGDVVFCEGAYGRYLLKDDVTKEDITIRRGGTIRPIDGPGLGVNVLEDALKRYTTAKRAIGS